jgi:Holliday junction resolvasome RuvABC endonuclease subunit
MTGNGNAKKDAVIESVNNMFNLQINDKNSHMADAVAIAYTFELWHNK